MVRDRTEESCREFLTELVGRLGECKPLFTSDELKVYAKLLLEMYHAMVKDKPTGKRGRLRKPQPVPHDDLDYVTVHKTRNNNRVVKVERNIVYVMEMMNLLMVKNI